MKSSVHFFLRCPLSPEVFYLCTSMSIPFQPNFPTSPITFALQFPLFSISSFLICYLPRYTSSVLPEAWPFFLSHTRMSSLAPSVHCTYLRRLHYTDYTTLITYVHLIVQFSSFASKKSERTGLKMLCIAQAHMHTRTHTTFTSHKHTAHTPHTHIHTRMHTHTHSRHIC